jgi:hypothetical protein
MNILVSKDEEQSIYTTAKGDIMKTIKIEIDYNNLDSIEQAEKTKTRLENKGYKVINTFGGMRFTALIMGK